MHILIHSLSCKERRRGRKGKENSKIQKLYKEKFKLNFVFMYVFFIFSLFAFRELEQMYDDERKVKKEVLNKLDKYVCFCCSLAKVV